MSSIDVIVPCYRYARYLRECVQSVLAQPGVDVRVLIIDDASPDHTPVVCEQLAREDARVSFRRHAENAGHIATYNEGIDWARSRYLLILSADDYLLPGALARATAVMDADHEIGLCFGEAPERHGDGTLRRLPPAVELPQGVASSVMDGKAFMELCRRRGSTNIVPTATAIVRTALQQSVGGYLAGLPHSGDFELWLRLAAHAKVAYLCCDQAVYRRHETNMSLLYYGTNCLDDLQQRRSAIEAFYASCEYALGQDGTLKESLLAPLALAAVRDASKFLDMERADLSRRLMNFASETDPSIRKSFVWKTTRCKFHIGTKTWQRMSRWIEIIREPASRLSAYLRAPRRPT